MSVGAGGLNLSRRAALKLGAAALGVAALPAGLLRPAFAQARTHGLSIFGDLKYGPGFPHFDYVNPDAPKGGRFVFTAPNWNYNQNPETFNTLNTFIPRSDAPPRMELTFAALMAGASDEPDSVYGYVAAEAEVADDGNEVRFLLRPEARFHDGSPITAEDAAWTMLTLKEQGHPSFRLPLKNVVEAVAEDAGTLRVRFDGKQSPQLKLAVAGMPILSKAWYASRDFTAATMEAPLGSGPYRVGRFETGRFIEYERVADWWAKDLNVARGQSNFDVIRLEFYRDRAPAFEALKKGDLTYREEFVSKTWVTEYAFPAIADGRVVKEVIPDEARPDFQAFYLNTRRAKLADPRTRRAIGLAFDFEWVNTNLFFGAYKRSASWFEGSNYAAAGEPSPAELALMLPMKDRLPPAAFQPPPVPEASDGSGRDRVRLREAARLLSEAGWTREGTGLVSASGERLAVEFLIDSTSFERVVAKWVDALRSIGVAATIRLVDPTQYQARLNDFDFDLVSARFSLGATPLEALRTFLTAEAADTPGTNNYSGIRDPAVDALVEAAIAAKDRETHRTALSALDRVLRAHFFAIPAWTSAGHRVAFWDMYARPETKPDYDFSPETTWWVDSEKAQRLGRPG